MKHLYLILTLLVLGRPAVLRAQTILMSAGTATSTSTGCAGTVYDAGGTINGYGASQNSTLTLRPTAATGRVSLNFTLFQTEKDYDFLEIYDGISTSTPLLARLSGLEGLNQTYTATNVLGALTLRFTSDASVERAGFAATLSCVPVPASTYTGNVGVGTTQPLEKLQVAGTIYSSQGGVRFPDGSLQNTAALTQQLSLQGSTLSLTDGGSVVLPGDNLGNHTATQNLRLNGRWLSNDGGNEGLRVSNNGNVGIGTASPQTRLHVNGSVRQDTYSSNLVSIPAGAIGTFDWTHNLGYQPTLMIVVDQTGGGGGEYVSHSYEHLSNNITRFYVRNARSSASSFRLHWIRVN
ncbi:CUB domain-containing protein [Hymenobacter lutimineralis]|uniref:CUB domain-containing protein n=1 Tax=Hymenobacter lutimineralis TaxID=2606448 RepID=A0A5D6V503_9BACT|nr:CUB domain-containing protein [Hymenobacter lutimineralis]TYZ10018.1 CUB domain-containing protein [Hymenobacter lutimineralis]